MRLRRTTGTAIIEYFVLALLVGVATVFFWLQPSGFINARLNVESAIDHSIARILAP
jgi:hypothetical protein